MAQRSAAASASASAAVAAGAPAASSTAASSAAAAGGGDGSHGLGGSSGTTAGAGGHPAFEASALRKKLAKMNFAQDAGHTQSHSMADLLATLSRTKSELKAREEAASPKPYEPPGGWKDVQIRVLETPYTLVRPRREENTISRFKLSEPKWDRTITSGPNLTKALYRTPEADTSGQRIMSLTRETSCPPGSKPWVPSDAASRTFEDPSLGTCTQSYRNLLQKTLEQTVTEVQEEYRKMPAKTESARTRKALLGADLYKMTRVRDALEEQQAEEEKQRNLLKSASGTGTKSTSLLSASASSAKLSSTNSSSRQMATGSVAISSPKSTSGK